MLKYKPQRGRNLCFTAEQVVNKYLLKQLQLRFNKQCPVSDTASRWCAAEPGQSPSRAQHGRPAYSSSGIQGCLTHSCVTPSSRHRLPLSYSLQGRSIRALCWRLSGDHI